MDIRANGPPSIQGEKVFWLIIQTLRVCLRSGCVSGTIVLIWLSDDLVRALIDRRIDRGTVLSGPRKEEGVSNKIQLIHGQFDITVPNWEHISCFADGSVWQCLGASEIQLILTNEFVQCQVSLGHDALQIGIIHLLEIRNFTTRYTTTKQ
jgi:hypothetical protein